MVIGRGPYGVTGKHTVPPRLRQTCSENGRRAYRLRFELPPPEGLIGVRHIAGNSSAGCLFGTQPDDATWTGSSARLKRAMANSATRRWNVAATTGVDPGSNNSS